VADVHDILKIEVLEDRGSIRCVAVHVVTVAHLRRAAVTATIVGNDTIPVLK
jgi:hypothetical protein